MEEQFKINTISNEELDKDANVLITNSSFVKINKNPNNLPKEGYLVDEVKLDKYRENLNNLKIELSTLEKELEKLNTVDFKRVFNITSQKEMLKYKIKRKSDEIRIAKMQIKMSENKRKLNLQNMIESN